MEHTVSFEVTGKCVGKKRVFSWGLGGRCDIPHQHKALSETDCQPTAWDWEVPVHRGLAGSRPRGMSRSQQDLTPSKCAAFSRRLPMLPSSPDLLLLCVLRHPLEDSTLCQGALFRKHLSTWNHLSAIVFLPTPRYPWDSFLEMSLNCLGQHMLSGSCHPPRFSDLIDYVNILLKIFQ